MAQKNFRAMAQTLLFWGFEPWLKPTFDMQILTSSNGTTLPISQLEQGGTLRY